MRMLARLGLGAVALTGAMLATAGCSNSGITGTDMGMTGADLATSGGDMAGSLLPDLAGPLPDLAGDPIVRVSGGFAQPFGAFFDSVTNAWYVSNVSGDLSNIQNTQNLKDGRGWITKISADLKTVDHTFFSTGLNSPTGLRVMGGKLYIADVDQLVVVDLALRTAVRSATVAPAIAFVPYVLMADVMVDSNTGIAYAPEAVGNRIIKFTTPTTAGGPYTTYSVAPATFPTTLYINAAQLIVGTTGNPQVAGSMGALYKMNLTDGVGVTRIGTLAANFQGIEYDPTDYFVGTTRGKMLYRINPTSGSSSGVHDYSMEGVASMGDIGWDPTGRVLAVPDVGTNSVYFQKM